MSAILDVEHVSMRKGAFALSDISFDTPRGEITAIVGPNGAGKSTLLDAITGFRRPPVGRIRLTRGDGRGFLLERMAAQRIAREARVVRTFQTARPFASMTVLENLVVGAVALKRREARKRALYWLDKAGLIPSANKPAGTLRYGQQRMLDVLRALLAAPELLCLDEPTAGMTRSEIALLETMLIETKNARGISILLIEHDLDFALRLAGRAIAMHNGLIVTQGSPEAIHAHPAVASAYLGTPEEAVLPRRIA
jgi:ABC-type branched-subunit amino acid transport system ATPase component